MPQDLLLAGTLLRLQLQDQGSAMTEARVQPRSSYCSNLQYGLPGGQEHVDVPVQHIWDLLAPKIRVKVSGAHVWLVVAPACACMSCRDLPVPRTHLRSACPQGLCQI